MSPEYFRGTRHNFGKAIVGHQGGIFQYMAEGEPLLSSIDAWVAASERQRTELLPLTPAYINKNKWSVIPNSTSTFNDHTDKIKGRVIHTASPDRGLHHLINVWPKIKERRLDATLRIFYEFDKWVPLLNGTDYPDKRVPQIVNARPHMADMGITMVQQVSREQILKENAEAEVMAYPCDPIMFTECFPTTILEACAVGTMPVTTDADSIPSIYGSVARIISRSRINEEFADAVIAALDEPHVNLNYAAKKTRLVEFAKQYTVDNMVNEWKSLISKLLG
jgi:glycosyltransferase involved in cell wall biosynthesis